MDTQETIAPIEPDPTEPDSRLRGVRGWLLYLCLLLTVFQPLISIGLHAWTTLSVAPAFGRFPGLLPVIIVDNVLAAGLAVFSVYAGILLWRVRPGAVATARVFLFANFAYVLLAPLLMLLAGLPGELARQSVAESYTNIGGSIGGAVIWLTYLQTSKRVRATYGDAPAPAQQALPADGTVGIG